MKRIVRLTERDLTRIVKRVIQEQDLTSDESSDNEERMSAESKIEMADENNEEQMMNSISELFGDMTEQEAENYVKQLTKRKPKWVRKLVRFFKSGVRNTKRDIRRMKRAEKAASVGLLVTYPVLVTLFLKYFRDIGDLFDRDNKNP